MTPPAPKALTRTTKESPAPLRGTPESGFARPWLALCVALAVHVCDEALTGFLAVYNPTVLEAHRRWPWFPMPTFTFGMWLGGLIVVVIVAALLTPLAKANRRGFRILAWIAAVLMFGNGLAHIAATIAGQTFADIPVARPAPGFDSAFLLLASSVWLMIRLHRTRAAGPAS